MELLYNNTSPILPNTTPTYNGNISAAIWQTVQPTGTTTPVTTGIKSYKYAYDNLNRLLSGVFTGNTAQNENYSEYIDVSTMVPGTKPYDLNGNILTLRRYGKLNNAFNTIDELTYTYDGNRLMAVQDVVATDNGGDFYESGTVNATEYTYDANGNLTKDDNKKIISITYNHLNLPATINKTGGNRIVYTYDASGNKVRQDYYINGTITKTTDFIGNFVYENGLPSCIVYDEGRVVYANNSRTYFGEIYLKDHLGNVRIACRRKNGVLKTRQVDSYYPFGMNIKGLTANSTDVNRPNEYLYNGKMMQDEMGLGWLDYGARFYDAILGRWHSPDPLAEQYRRWSPYNYCVDNPMRFIDPDGMGVHDPPGGMGRSIIGGLEHAGMTPEQISVTTQQMGVAGLTVAKVAAIGVTMVLAPEVGIPWAVADITGAPVTPAPQAWSSTIPSTIKATTTEVSSVAKADEGMTVLYRGVNESHVGFEDALKGVAKPKGGDATPTKHNLGNTNSEYTSWTTNQDVAINYAKRPEGNGVVLQKTASNSDLVKSPSVKSVNLIQSPGKVVNESEVLMHGVIKNCSIKPF